LSFIVVCYQFLPLLLRTPPAGMATARFALWVLPAGFAVVLAGFLTSAVWLQLAVGWPLLSSIAFVFFDPVRSGPTAGSPGTAATAHLLIGAFFLPVAPATGLAMG